MPPKILPFAFGDEPSNLGDSASVQCVIATGDFPINITWTLNDQPVLKYHGINTVALGKKMSALSIESVSVEHAGNYSCQASNVGGTASQSTELVINGWWAGDGC